MMAHRSACVRAVVVLLGLTAVSISAGAQMWTQTDWSGGPGQLGWSDSTMYYAGIHEDGWRLLGDLKLDAPDDSNWVNTGDLAGATVVFSLLEASDGALYAGTDPSAEVFKSIDAGTTWINTGDLAGADLAIALTEASDGALYAGTDVDGDVFKSVDAGTTWVNTGDLAGAAYVWSLLEASDGALYAGTYSNGDVFKSIDAGATWDTTGDLAGATAVFSLLEASDGALYAGTRPNGDVFKSIDAGTTWVNTDNLAGATVVFSLLEASDGALYAGTGFPNGDVFKSTDAGTTWSNTGDVAGAGAAWSLLETSDGALYAATESNGDVLRTGYFLAGDIVSSIYQTESASVTYGAMTWNETPNGQTISMLVRTDTLPDMSTAMDWDSCPAVVNGQDISGLSSVNDGDVYIQYRAELSTSRNDVTPYLHDIAIEYTVDLEGPVPDPAVASDGINPVPGIDDDDYVLITFDEPTNKPAIDALNINNVLALSGGHSWLDGFGLIDTTYWNPTGDQLTIELSITVSPPTVAVGDTITPDGVTIIDEWGNPAVSPVIITGSFSPPGVEERRSRLNGQGSTISLLQNEPNPLSESTIISYSLRSATHVTLDVYDLSGRLVETLVNEAKGAGIYRVSWNANGRAAGLYFYRLRAGDFKSTRKMVVID